MLIVPVYRPYLYYRKNLISIQPKFLNLFPKNNLPSPFENTSNESYQISYTFPKKLFFTLI